MNNQLPQLNKKGLNTPKNRQLAADAILILASLIVPHASLPIAVFGMVKLVIDFHESRNEEGEE